MALPHTSTSLPFPCGQLSTKRPKCATYIPGHIMSLSFSRFSKSPQRLASQPHPVQGLRGPAPPCCPFPSALSSHTSFFSSELSFLASGPLHLVCPLPGANLGLTWSMQRFRSQLNCQLLSEVCLTPHLTFPHSLANHCAPSTIYYERFKIYRKVERI